VSELSPSQFDGGLIKALLVAIERAGASSFAGRSAPLHSTSKPTSIQTGLADFGHSCAEVPKSLHIRAYPRVYLIEAVYRAITKPL
jgi:hypothetical protein